MADVRKLLVTGGAGFIGSFFVHYVRATYPEWHVVVLDKLTYAGNLANLASAEGSANFTFVHGDICDRDMVMRAMHGCDWVLNFAAETHVDRSIIDPGGFVRTDVEGTYTLLEAAREQGVERFIQISTDEVYEKQLPLFIVNALEDRALPVYGDGRNTRDWIHVSDHCSALVGLLQAPADLVNGEVFNVGAAEERSILQNAQFVLDLLGKPHDLIRFVPDRLGHVRRHAVDSAKLRKALGWTASVRFEEGLAETVEWYRTHSDWLAALLARRDAFLSDALALADKAASGGKR